MPDTTIKIHELSEELDPDEASVMKQQSRLEGAKRLRDTREAGGDAGLKQSDD